VSAAAEWSLEHGVTPMCPAWCYGGHQDGLLEGSEPWTLYEHFGSEFGEILLELRRPFGDGEQLRRGGDGWRAWLESVQGPDGWVSRDRAYVEVASRHDDDSAREKACVRLELTSGELRDLSRALEKLADFMD
jgi:hypothetical protein